MNNLKKLRIDKNLTVRELSSLVNINYATLSRLENEESHFNNDYIKVLSGFFNVTSDYLLGITDSLNQTRRFDKAIQAEKIPVYSLIFGGENKLRKENLIDEEFAPAVDNLEKCVYMLASNEYKSEGIFKGDLLLVRLTDVIEAGLVVVARKNEPGEVRRLVELNKQWVLLAENNLPSSIDGYEVLGEVLIVSRKVKK
jgi:SOS-response transcriptional repressor LexA